METYQEKLLHCCEAYRGTGSAQMLMTYRSRTDRLSFDERMTVVRECQEAFAPFFLEMCSLVPRLNESDLLFCALSAMGFSSVIIAECLTITPDAVRMRKLRFRDKVGADVFETLFPTPEKGTPTKQKRNISERDEHVTNESCTATADALPLPTVSINPLTSKSMKTKTTKMTFGKAIKRGFQQYFTTKGRASRPEFLYFLLFLVLVKVAWSVFVGIDAALFSRKILQALTTLITKANYSLLPFIGILFIYLLPNIILAIPLFTLAARRLHDTERSGKWIWMYLAPYLIQWIMFMAAITWYVYQFKFGKMNELSVTGIAILIMLLTQITGIILLIWLCKEGTEGPNRYGPDPTVVPIETTTETSPESHTKE